MLPLPTSSRPKQTRLYFPSLPPTQSYNSQTLFTYLRSRTRLTNLAFLLILTAFSLSLLINLDLYLSPTNPFPARRKELEVPPSIEMTIERDPRFQELDHLILVACHAIWTGRDGNVAGADEDWVLEPMQRGGSVRTFIKHIQEGVKLLRGDPKALLVFSGGATRPPPSPPLPESLSYLSLANALSLLPSNPLPSVEGARQSLPLNLRAATEEYALDSYENLLFALARFREVTGRWAERVTVVSYGMKRQRFEQLHRAAIGFPPDRFSYVGIDDEGDTTEHYAGELKHGFTPFLTSPSGCHPPLSTKRLLRNPYFRYHPYHTSCPELVELLEWCPLPSSSLPEIDVEGALRGERAVFDGWVPWGEDGEVRWGRERDG